MVQATAKLPVRAIRVRKPVPVLQDPDLKVVRCLCTAVFQREDLQTAILKKL